MARPTTWRRSWNLDQGAVGAAEHLALVVVQPGETLGGVWWTYKMHSGPFSSTSYPPAQSTTIVGMQLKPDSELPLDPLIDAQGEWLWWEPVTWFTTGSASTDLNWLHEAWGPRTDRKMEALRKAPTSENAVLTVSMRTDQQDAGANFVNGIRIQVAVSALIILP